MDPSKPPITCDGCGEPIWPGSPSALRYGTDKNTGEVVTRFFVYHRACAPWDGKRSRAPRRVRG